MFVSIFVEVAMKSEGAPQSVYGVIVTHGLLENSRPSFSGSTTRKSVKENMLFKDKVMRYSELELASSYVKHINY